ncbi:MAG: hypothetical protein PHU42_00505 [Patescibacteria group bacterium]|nr:hypothetical protein [Patescibacteria group bacterium]
MKIKNLEESILFTISYFDVFEYPLTSFEIWRYLFNFNAELEEVILKMDELIRHGKIEMKNGFYFLPERSDLVEKRQDKYDISEKFWDRAVLAAKILSYLPFIKMISVVNSLAFFNCDKNSDIDFFIITEKNKIWTARALSSILLHILGLRRHGRKVAKRICLSFYISEEKMNLKYIANDSLGFFVAYWIGQCTPIVNVGKTYQTYRSQNSWIYQYLPNVGGNITNYYINFRKPLLADFTKKVLASILQSDFFERTARSIQIKKIEKSQEKRGSPNSVIFNDLMLKFHPVDLRIEYKKKLVEKLKKVLK